MSLVALVRAMLAAKQPTILWWGPELTQLYNDAMLDSMRDKHPSGMGQPAREAWREAWKAVGHELQAVVDQGIAIWQEDMFVPVDRNGRIEDAWWTYNYSPVFDDDGSRAGLMITCTETTRGVVARRELHAVLDQTPTPIAILTGDDYTFQLANPAYLRMVGRDVIGKPVLEAFSGQEVGHFMPLLDRAYRGGETVTVHDNELTLDGKTQYIDVMYQPYLDASGTRIGVLAQHTDVTNAVLARRARDEFLAMLSHELRNPLAPIASAAELMRLTGDRHPREREIIERQVIHLQRLVDDLLDVARISRGKLVLHKAPVALDEVLRNAIDQAMPLILARHHELAQTAIGERLVVDGDAVRLAQVFANLLTNAARYVPAHGHIEIIVARDGDSAVVTVADNGPGIDPALLPKAFELFVQGERRVDRSEGGLGLGLALVKRLVEMHGGTVAAGNRATGGAELVVRLPVALVAPVAIAATAPIVEPDASRVLIIDDNEDAAVLLGEILERNGHVVQTAFDGPSALAQLATFDAGTVVCDIGLPGMDGFEVARQIRKLGGKRRLIAVTGYGSPGDRDATRSAGFDLHLTKPVSVGDLLRAVDGGGGQI